MAANVVHRLLVAATTRVLPAFAAADEPFFLVFWSRDPGGTRHNQGDSLSRSSPASTGRPRAPAIRNVDEELGRMRATVAELGLAGSTDIIVAADHGFSTISKESETSPAAKARSPNVPPACLPKASSPSISPRRSACR